MELKAAELLSRDGTNHVENLHARDGRGIVLVPSLQINTA